MSSNQINRSISQGPAARVSQIVVQIVRELSHFVHSLNRAHSPFGEPRIWDLSLASPFHVLAVYAYIVVLILGPLAVIPLGVENVNLYASDIVAGVLFLYWVYHWKNVRAVVWREKSVQLYFIFTGLAFFSFWLSPVSMNGMERFTAFLYLVRFISYFSLFLTAYSWGCDKKIKTRILGKLGWFGVGISLLGWLQYFLYPDLRNLYYLGWDPHFKRIFSTYFDPNFLGLLLVFSLILFLFEKRISALFYLKLLSVFATLLFTYSRSSYLAFVAALLYWAVAYKRFFIAGIAIFTLFGLLVLLPRPSGEGVKLERLFSIRERVENWKLGVQMFTDHPILGVGFNTIRYAKKIYLHEKDSDYLTNHSGAGLDNSLLFVGVTTGIVGFLTYLIFLGTLFKSVSLPARITLVAAVLHSSFQNSLFFPWIMMWVWLVCGLSRRR